MVKQIKIDGIVGTGEGEISASFVKSQLPINGLDPIEIVIHSEGGSVFEGFAIYDALCQYQGPKKCIVSSYAASISSFIPMSCDEVWITPNGYMMMHEPYSEEGGRASEMLAGGALLNDMKQKMIAAYCKKSGRSAEEITAILSKDTFFNAEQCLANGFVNRIAPTPVVGRMVAKAKSMPHGIFQALFGAGPGGDNREPTREKSMSESLKPVAATVTEIKRKFPKAKSDFIVKCMEKEMAMEEVAVAAMEETMMENETLSAKVKAMEDELMALKAAAPMTPLPTMQPEVETEMEYTNAKATGVKPVAKATSSTMPSAKARWNDLISAKLRDGVPKAKAAIYVNRENPGLREQMLAEVNS
jgi:ATP-dependent protease ClpP protease subunit